MTNEGKYQDLESEDTWDYESAEVHLPRQKRRVVTSVSFRSEEFETVTEAAKRADMKTSEFIRSAALEKANDQTDFLLGIQSSMEVSFLGAMTSTFATFGTSIYSTTESMELVTG